MLNKENGTNRDANVHAEPTYPAINSHMPIIDALSRAQSEHDLEADGEKKKSNIWMGMWKQKFQSFNCYLETLYECAGGSTLHGVSHICYPGRIGFKKMIWLLVFCLAMFYFVRHTQEMIKKYYEFPHRTSETPKIWIEQKKSQFFQFLTKKKLKGQWTFLQLPSVTLMRYEFPKSRKTIFIMLDSFLDSFRKMV